MSTPTEQEVLAALRTIVTWIGSHAPPSSAPEFYSSTAPPPGRSREAFNEACRTGRVAGARKSGREWIVPVAKYHETLATTEKRRRRECAPAPVNDSAEALLARAGVKLRMVK